MKKLLIFSMAIITIFSCKDNINSNNRNDKTFIEQEVAKGEEDEYEEYKLDCSGEDRDMCNPRSSPQEATRAMFNLLESGSYDLDTFKNMVFSGANLTEKNRDGYNALELVLMAYQKAVGKPIARSQVLRSAASDSNNSEEVAVVMATMEFIINYSPEIIKEKTPLDSRNGNIYHYAVRSRNYYLINAIMKLGAGPTRIDIGATVKDDDGYNPLTLSLKLTDSNTVNTISCNQGTVKCDENNVPLQPSNHQSSVLDNIDFPDGNGKTALIRAIDSNNLAEIEKLVKAGADINRFYNGITPLDHAIYDGKTSSAITLIYLGANLALKDITSGNTPLIAASEKGNIAVINEILSRKNDVGYLNERNSGLSTAIIGASYYGHLNIFLLLLNSGADMNIRKHDGSDALSLAHSSIVSYLRNHRGNCLIVSSFSIRPIWIC